MKLLLKTKIHNKDLQENSIYEFLKRGQRAYWLEGEQPLLEKSENGSISAPIASIIILELTHFMNNEKIYTKGEIYFNSCEPIKNQ